MKLIFTSLKTLLLIPAFFAGYLVEAQYTVTNAFPQLPVLTKPLEMTFPNDGTNRLFLVEQGGKIYVIPNSTTTTKLKVFLNLSDSVVTGQNEMGLLGLAFHPDYKNNGYFYVNYNRFINGTYYTYIARYTVSATNPDSAVKASKKILMKFAQPYTNHNGGCLRFGTDGYLYDGQGDGGSSNDPNGNAQKLNSYLGKMLRIDVDKETANRPYDIPADNPFINTANAYPEIYAYGLRNPWRFSIDPVTNLLWVGDVGQNYLEEVDIVEKGKNYGWNTMEGFQCRGGATGCNKTGLSLPVYDYYNSAADPKNQGNCSVTGGFVYRGNAIPDLQGKYVFGDYCSGRIWAITYIPGVDTSVAQLVVAPSLISSFALDQNNEIYVIGQNKGIIYKLGKTSTTGLEIANSNSDIQINSLFPNPVLNSFTIEFNKKQIGNTKVRLKNCLGTIVNILSDSELPSGSNVLTFDLPKIESGVYFVEIETAQSKQVMKLVKE
jgi:glucose/arabinose dehydrogenase